MKKPIQVMLIEDNAAYRKAIGRSLSFEPDFELADQFGTAEIALRSLQDLSRTQAPDVILLDLNLPGMSGLETIPWIKKYVPSTEILVLTQSDKDADALAAISAGASGYLLKSSSLDQLLDGIKTVADGGSILDTGVARFLLNTLQKKQPEPIAENTLTARELEVLTLIGEGLVKKEVADRLGISPKTVSIHTTHIYEKLNVSNAPAAITKAYKIGLFPPS